MGLQWHGFAMATIQNKQKKNPYKKKEVIFFKKTKNQSKNTVIVRNSSKTIKKGAKDTKSEKFFWLNSQIQYFFPLVCLKSATRMNENMRTFQMKHLREYN